MKSEIRIKVATVVSMLILSSATAFAETPADNTKVNERDQATEEVTADQQAMNGSDTDLTRKIRQEIIANKNLSTYAHNVKIITVKGEVTLKGPVRSKTEENTVLKYAESVAGRSKVINKLEIARAK